MPPSGVASKILLGERAVVGAYKTFFRDQDQSRFTIPMQLAILGRPVQSRAMRALAGVGYLGVIGGGLLAIDALQAVAPPLGRWALALTVGAAGGWFSAFGGAWKDAPIEGFQTLKFFRSPIVAMVFGWIVFGFTDAWAVGTLASIGYTVAAIETYKTFFTFGKTPGKFAGQPVRFPAMLARRRWGIPVFASIWLGLAGTLWASAG